MNLLSSFLGQHVPFAHYAAIFIAISFSAAVVGLDRARLKEKPRRLRGLTIAILIGCVVSIFFIHRPYSFLSSCPDKFGYPEFEAKDLAVLHKIEAMLSPEDSLTVSRSLASHFGKRDKLLHIIHDPDVVMERDYEYILWDRQVPTFISPDKEQQLVKYLTENFAPVVGSGGDRIILFKKK
jgi:hypothetical protein